MTSISKRAYVEYNANQMYLLVNDIKSYPEFLPWCTATNIIQADNDSLTASVSIATGKIKQTFTTANKMVQDSSISMSLVKGPFKELHGYWRFKDAAIGCSVSLDMRFEFKNILVKHTLGTTFHKVMDSLMDAFIKRSRIVYGKN